MLRNLGHACAHLGESERAQHLFLESFDAFEAQGNVPGMAGCLVGFAFLALGAGEPEDAARFLAAAEAHGGPHVTSTWPATRMEYEACLAGIAGALRGSALQAAQRAGRRMSISRASDAVRRFARRGAAARAARRAVSELTEREHAVVELIVRGAGNGDIAAELGVSKRTVEKHVAHIRSKLGVEQRTEIVRWAWTGGLAERAGEAAPRELGAARTRPDS